MRGVLGEKRIGLIHARKIMVHRSRSVDRRGVDRHGVSRAELGKAVDAVGVQAMWREDIERRVKIRLSNGRVFAVDDAGRLAGIYEVGGLS